MDRFPDSPDIIIRKASRYIAAEAASAEVLFGDLPLEWLLKLQTGLAQIIDGKKASQKFNVGDIVLRFSDNLAGEITEIEQEDGATATTITAINSTQEWTCGRMWLYRYWYKATIQEKDHYK